MVSQGRKNGDLGLVLGWIARVAQLCLAKQNHGQLSLIVPEASIGGQATRRLISPRASLCVSYGRPPCVPYKEHPSGASKMAQQARGLAMRAW